MQRTRWWTQSEDELEPEPTFAANDPVSIEQPTPTSPPSSSLPACVRNPLRDRKRPHNRVCAFQAISRTRLGAAATFACFSPPSPVTSKNTKRRSGRTMRCADMAWRSTLHDKARQGICQLQDRTGRATRCKEDQCRSPHLRQDAITEAEQATMPKCDCCERDVPKRSGCGLNHGR